VRDWRTCLQELQEGRCDLAITDVPSAHEHADLETEQLFDAPMVVFCSAQHPLAGKQDPELSDLMGYPWAAPLMQGRYLGNIPSDLGAAGRIDPETRDFVPAICADSFSAMTAAVRNGRAISAAPSTFIRDDIERGDFVVLPVREPWMRMSYGLTRTSVRSHPPGKRRSPCPDDPFRYGPIRRGTWTQWAAARPETPLPLIGGMRAAKVRTVPADRRGAAHDNMSSAGRRPLSPTVPLVL